MKIPTIVDIFIFISKTKLDLSLIEYEKNKFYNLRTSIY